MTGVKKNFLKLTLDKSHFITERRISRICSSKRSKYSTVSTEPPFTKICKAGAGQCCTTKPSKIRAYQRHSNWSRKGTRSCNGNYCNNRSDGQKCNHSLKNLIKFVHSLVIRLTQSFHIFFFAIFSRELLV